MRLTKEEENMLAGKEGPGYQKAMEILVKMGEFYDAKRMVPVTMAFLTIGPSPAKPAKAMQWLHELADQGTKFKVPLALSPIENASVIDVDLHKQFGGYFGIASSGHPRNLFTQPIYGQHLVADGTAITHYCNSYIGARANTECFVGQYCAALTGRTPEYGFHLTENRLGKTLFDVKVDLKDETDWSALGYYISITLGKNYWDVPVINGIDVNKTNVDELVALCSTIPAYGACVHSLMVGVSPEAYTVEQAFGGKKPLQTYTVGAKEIKSVFNMFSTKKTVPDMVSLGGFGVNVSIESLYKLARLVEGKKVSSKFPTVCLVDNPVKQVADKSGITEILTKAGILIGLGDYFKGKGVTTSDFSNNPVTSANRLGLKTLVFMDAKSCHYIGNQEIEPVLKSLEDCVKIALAGKMEVR